MDDKTSVVKRQVERGDIIDDKARDIYRIAILVVSIIVAAAAINIDISDVVQTLMYDFGVLLNIDDSAVLEGVAAYLGTWALLPAIVFALIIAILFALAFMTMVWLFFAPPYYAVRAQASAPISTDESTFILIEKDIIAFFNTYINDRYLPQKISMGVPDSHERQIISEIDKEFEEFDGLENLIDHNKEVLSNKRENISRAKDGTQRFFISIILFSLIVVVMIYV